MMAARLPSRSTPHGSMAAQTTFSRLQAMPQAKAEATAPHGDHHAAPCSLQGSRPGAAEPQRPIKVVGCGSCGVDYLASVAAFPYPDQKLRTDTLQVQGGGNCANALTTAARLGLHPSIISKVGGDSLGDSIISELRADGIDTSLLLREPNHASPFTYIIVDRAGSTRTCIHTPGAAFQPEEMHQELIDEALRDAALVYFDGRLAEAAILLARAARAAGVPVLVEGERLRPGLQELLAEADYVITSAHFPQEWTGEAHIGDALVEVARRLPAAKIVISTQGVRGSICLVRTDNQSVQSESLPALLEQLFSQVSQQQQQQHTCTGSSTSPACRSSTGVSILPAHVAAAPGSIQLQRSNQGDTKAAAAAAKQAAEAAAVLNADEGNARRYAADSAASGTSSAAVCAHVIVASAAGLPPGAVVDTTGAGDAFIGSVIYGIVTGMQPEQMLQLAAVVAACKCTMLGARPGLPRREQLGQQLLGGVDTDVTV